MMTLHLTLAALLALAGCGQIGSRTDGVAADSVQLPETNVYEILTPEGRMVVRLFDDTPLHRDNFKRLVQEGLYDSTTFHRVIEGFMIQGGDPNSNDNDPYNDGEGGPGYTIPAEFRAEHVHKRGALATAREGDLMNPERASSGSQFYIVDGGTPFDSLTLVDLEAQVQRMSNNPNFHYSPEQLAAYMTEGGAPTLDMQYTVFGELIEGFDVLDRIAAAPTARKTQTPAPEPLFDRPPNKITMVIRPVE